MPGEASGKNKGRTLCSLTDLLFLTLFVEFARLDLTLGIPSRVGLFLTLLRSDKGPVGL